MRTVNEWRKTTLARRGIHITPEQLMNDQTYKTLTGADLARAFGGEPYRCSVPGCGESGVCDECRRRGAR